ncbi:MULTISPECIES: DUF6177 family protein [unclassified Streptomyces]|nr:DUF6177 family protein [Streptomyces sp. NBC_01294]WRZ55163.1 DUF6177 family protein [Streptomyces sp. NBC_01294]
MFSPSDDRRYSTQPADAAAVVLQDRPVVPMTSWLSEALRATGTGR